MKIGPGVFVPVVGPSGAGKDSVMGFARDAFAQNGRIHFARRVITRPASPEAEDHDTLSEDDFRAAEREGAFALSWGSHGLLYGIPSEVDDLICNRGVVIANLSRASVAEARTRYANVMPVLITVSPHIMALRLAARGRESAADIETRIARNASYSAFGEDCHRIDNSGELEEAGNAFVHLVMNAVEQATMSEAGIRPPDRRVSG